MADDTPTPGNPPATATGTTGEVNDWRVDASRPNDIRIIAPNGETRVRADGLMTLGVHCAMAVGECDRLAAAVERLTRALKRIADASPTFRIQQMARAALASAPRPAPEPGARHDDPGCPSGPGCTRRHPSARHPGGRRIRRFRGRRTPSRRRVQQPSRRADPPIVR